MRLAVPSRIFTRVGSGERDDEGVVLIEVVLPLAGDHRLGRLVPAAVEGEDERHLLGHTVDRVVGGGDVHVEPPRVPEAVDDGGEVLLVEHLVTEDGALIDSRRAEGPPPNAGWHEHRSMLRADRSGQEPVEMFLR